MIHTELRGTCLWVTLATPTTRNALTDAMVEGLHQSLAQVAEHSSLRAILLRGAGGTFCAGGDFSSFKAVMAVPPPADATDPIARFNRGFGALLEKLIACEVATIVVVEGAAMGGGVGLAAACDFVLAADSAQFAMPEVTLGLPPAQIAPFVAARIGHGTALRLMLTGQRIDAARVQALGLADEVHAADALEARIAELLAQLQRAEPAALRATKAVLRQRQSATLAATLDFAADAFARSLRSGTASEGLAALAAKRKPNWVATTGESSP
jgi:isohexenylglutaconyl-CoA hydratase